NREAMRHGAIVIYLHASVEHQLARTARDRNRPLLQTENPARVLSDLLALRDPLYREVATLIIETDIRPPRMVVQEIMRFLSTYQGS
ncbi:MAG: shikimate kinase AroK, partial [Gammaproteobacteria bacterium]|nr:shikimate kinase AroK [Gammaproteobacteria bacterium]